MMNEDTLKAIAGKQKMPLGTIEKDYALTIILSKLYNTSFAKEIVFKGGTAIKKAYFPKARFSEDLDFTCTKTGTPKKIKEFLKKEISGNKIECIQFTRTATTNTMQNSVKLKQAYTDISGHGQSIILDLSLREKVLLPVQQKQLTNAYDQPKTKTSAMNLEEIMAEKIRALQTRGLPRDLYDIWFLAKKNVKINREIVEQKLAYYKEELSTHKIEETVRQIKTTWKRDLDRLIRPVPDYSRTAAETTRTLKQIKF